MAVAIDYVTQPAPSDQLKGLVAGVLIYTKFSSQVTIRTHLAAGLPFGVIFETTTTEMDGGYAAGASHGAAVTQWMNSVGLPADKVPVRFCDDEPVQRANYSVRTQYMQGVRSTFSGPRMYYGQGELIEYLWAAGALEIGGVMSESDSFPGNGHPSAHTVLWQRPSQYEQVPGLGGSYDVNHILATDWGQWPRPNAPKPQETDDMVIFPKRLAVATAYAGRKVALGFDPVTKTLFLCNGGQFADSIKDFKVTQWPVPNPTGVSSTAQCTAVAGAVDFGLNGGGDGAVVLSKGDCGTLDAPFKNVAPVVVPTTTPPPTIDIPTLAKELAPHFGVTAE